jgi:opacity protein-like surface antigen
MIAHSSFTPAPGLERPAGVKQGREQMVSLFSRARASAVLALIGALLSPAAHSPMAFAADMPFFTPPPAPVNDEPVEWGTGWYLRGDIGAAHVSPEDLNGVVLTKDFANNWTAGLGGGYQYNKWFRTDITVDFQSLYNKTGAQAVLLPCQIGAVGTPVGGPFTGSTPIFAGCSPIVRNRTEAASVLANAYVDLGNWYGFTPYIGAGVGVNVLYQKAQTNWYMGNLVPYAGTTWTDPFTLGTYMANWDKQYNATYLRFAYGLMAGVAYDLTDHIKVDVGYRYLNLGKIEGVDSWNNRVSRDLQIHQARIGFRYVID